MTSGSVTCPPLAVSGNPSKSIMTDVLLTLTVCDTAVPTLPPPSVNWKAMLRLVKFGLEVVLLKTTF